jgi:flagellar biosynthesis GTPase FlhF
MMTEQQFDALAKLNRMRNGPAREACRMVLVDGMGVPDAARAVGMEYRVAHQAVTRAKAAYALALEATSKRAG